MKRRRKWKFKHLLVWLWFLIVWLIALVVNKTFPWGWLGLLLAPVISFVILYWAYNQFFDELGMASQALMESIQDYPGRRNLLVVLFFFVLGVILFWCAFSPKIGFYTGIEKIFQVIEGTPAFPQVTPIPPQW